MSQQQCASGKMGEELSYTSSALSAKANFVGQELAVKYLSFPPEIDQSYSRVIDWLGTLEGMQDFDKTRNFDLDSHDWPDVGRQVSQLLPSHTLKAYQCLLHLEQETLAEEATSLLDQPNILIIDDGCGGGTASAALLALVANYQRYRFTNGLPIHPVHVSCYGIDPNPTALRVYVEFIRNCAIRVRDLLIDVSDPTIFPGTLPDNSSDVAKVVSEKDRTHCVFLALSNIIRPLTQEHAHHSIVHRLIESLGIDDLLPKGWRGYIGSKEIGALRSILDANIVDRVIILLVGARRCSHKPVCQNLIAGRRAELTPSICSERAKQPMWNRQANEKLIQ
jgi:SAM-dependent methyltransferase